MSKKTVGAQFSRIALMLGGLAIIAGVSGAISLTQLNGDIARSVEITNRREDVLIPAEATLANLRYDVVQVQQFLSDVSATRGQDGLDDGFAKADEKAKAFTAALGEMRALANQDPELKSTLGDSLDKTAKAFDSYYAVGKEMAQAYVEGGPALGNKLMGEFDEGAEALDKSVDKVSEAVSAIGDRSHEECKIASDAMINAASMWRLALLSVVAATVGIVALALAFTNKINSRLAKVVGDINDVSLGKHADVVVGSEGDDIAEMNQALQRFIEAERRKKQLEEEERRRLDAERQRQARIAEATQRFDQSVGGLLGKIKQAAGHLNHSASTLSANAEQTQRQSNAVAHASEEATLNVQTVSSAGTELTASINEIARRMNESAAIAQAATTEAGEATTKIGGLSEAAHKIGEVVSLINSIASQTNLLALNATIESARAGEAGKGFAVVAHEVKNLAGQTGRATEDIGRQIASVQSETAAAVQAIDGIASTIGRINELATAIAGAVEEQGAATAEIARNAEQASQGTQVVVGNISGVAQAAEETGRMAQVVYAAAQGLLEESGTLEREVESFLVEVRAA